MFKEFSKRKLMKMPDVGKIATLVAGGADSTLNFAMLLGINGFSYMVLLDNDHKGSETKERLIKVCIPESAIFIPTIQENNGVNETDIEDLFSRDVYCDAFYSIYSDETKLSLEECKIQFNDDKKKINKVAKELLKGQKVELDKKGISLKILEIISTSDKIDKYTENNFKYMFNSVYKSVLELESQ